MTIITNDYQKMHEVAHLTAGLTVYFAYWVIIALTWKVCIQPTMKKKTDYVSDEEEESDESRESVDSSSKELSSLEKELAHDTSSNADTDSDRDEDEKEYADFLAFLWDFI